MNFDQMPTPDQFQALKDKGYLNTDFNPTPMVAPPPPPPEPMVEEPMVEDVGYEPVAAPEPFVMQPNPEMEKAFQQKEAAIQKAGAAGQAQAVAEANYMQEKNKQAEMMFAEDQAKIQKGIEDAGQAMAKLQEDQDKVAQMKVDPSRYWSQKTTGQKILAGISLALGAIGAGFTGRNDAATVIANQIEGDLQQQKQAIDQKREDVAAKKGIYKDMLASYGDSQMALNAARASYFKGVETDVMAMAARAKGAEIKNNADMLLADLRMKRMGEEEKVKSRYAQLASINSGQLSPELLDEKQLARYVPGAGLALDKESAKIMREATVNTKTGVDSIQQLLNISNRPMKSVSLEDRKEAQVLATSLKAALRTELIGPGAVSESEWKLLDSIVANPTNVFSLDSSNQVALKTLGKKMEKNLAEKAKMYIVTPQGKSTQIRTTKPGGYEIVK